VTPAPRPARRNDDAGKIVKEVKVASVMELVIAAMKMPVASEALPVKARTPACLSIPAVFQ
jgi:hypothetical protein